MLLLLYNQLPQLSLLVVTRQFLHPGTRHGFGMSETPKTGKEQGAGYQGPALISPALIQKRDSSRPPNLPLPNLQPQQQFSLNNEPASSCY